MSDDVFVTETRPDGSTYQRQLYGIERIERATTLEEQIAGLRQIVERDAAGSLDCNWSDDSVRALAQAMLDAVGDLRAEIDRFEKYTDMGIAVADARRLRKERDDLRAESRRLYEQNVQLRKDLEGAMTGREAVESTRDGVRQRDLTRIGDLRAALAEALNGWSGVDAPLQHELARIAALRAKFLGGGET